MSASPRTEETDAVVSSLDNHLTIPFAADQAVKCPQCGSSAGLHFDEVSLIDPAGGIVPLHADAGEGLSVVAAMISDRSASGGRHKVVLSHWCAECGKQGELVLRQQSGQTFGEYREVTAKGAAPSEAAPDA